MLSGIENHSRNLTEDATVLRAGDHIERMQRANPSRPADRLAARREQAEQLVTAGCKAEAAAAYHRAAAEAPTDAERAELAGGETVIALTPPLPIDAPPKCRGGCSRMTVSPTARPSACGWSRNSGQKFSLPSRPATR